MDNLHRHSLLLKKNWEELSETEQKLAQRAIDASANAYAPYSKFLVGAAALLANQEIVIGSNQENAAYPSGLCAERTCLFAVGAQFPSIPILKLAIYSPSVQDTTKAVSPCGGCRQVLYESEMRQSQAIEILLISPDLSIFIAQESQVFLPYPFGF